MSPRYVLVGLARARTTWFTELARWATNGVLAIDFVKALSAEEVVGHLAGGRVLSAVILDGSHPEVDRDLLGRVTAAGWPVIVAGGPDRDWPTFGATATLPPTFERDDLLATLRKYAEPVVAPRSVAGPRPAVHPAPGFRCPLVTVTGAGGTGTSTLAAALAQRLALDVGRRDQVVLADLCRRADQGLLHHAPDVVPGLRELVDIHRASAPGPDLLDETTWSVEHRHYRLMLGLRTPREWTALRRPSVEAALDGLRRSCRLVVADCDDDFEGERETGSADVEDRNVLARTATAMADVVVVTGTPGVSGTAGLVRTVRDLLAAGIAATQIVPVINRCEFRGRRRREAVRTVVGLLGELAPIEIRGPVVVPHNRNVEIAVRDGAPLPDAVSEAVATAVEPLLAARAPRTAPPDEAMAPVVPGSLGSWTAELAG